MIVLPFLVPNVGRFNSGRFCAVSGLWSRIENTIAFDSANVHDMTGVL